MEKSPLEWGSTGPTLDPSERPGPLVPWTEPGLRSGAVPRRVGPQRCVDQGVTQKARARTEKEREMPGLLRQSHGEPERRVPSQQPPHANEARTAYFILRRLRPGRSRGGASPPAATIGPRSIYVRGPARETLAGWRGRSAGAEPGIPVRVGPRPSSRLQRLLAAAAAASCPCGAPAPAERAAVRSIAPCVPSPLARGRQARACAARGGDASQDPKAGACADCALDGGRASR